METREWLTPKDSERLKDNKVQCSGCGSDMLFFTVIETDRGYRHHVTCSECEARGGKAMSKKQAIDEWNRQGE